MADRGDREAVPKRSTGSTGSTVRCRDAQHREDLDTDRLVTRIQAGDREAYGDIYTRYFDRVFAYMSVALKRPEDAEDAAQQVFTKALEALPRYERRGRPFRSWLFTIARNCALVQLKQDDRYDLVDPAELARQCDSREMTDEEQRVLNWLSDSDILTFIERLPLAQRQAVVLRHLLGFSNAEIAKVLDRSQEAVRMLQSRAAGFIRDRLTSLGRAPERHDRAPSQARVPQARVVRTRRFSLTDPGPTA